MVELRSLRDLVGLLPKGLAAPVPPSFPNLDAPLCARLLQVRDSGCWLESGPAGGRRLLMLDEHWALQGSSASWELALAGTTYRYAPRPGESIFDLIGLIESGWLREQPDGWPLLIYLGYECGWQIEKRRRRGEPSPMADFIVLCPKMALEQTTTDALPTQWVLSPHFQAPAPLSAPRYTPPAAWASGCTLHALESQASYVDKVQRVREEIRAGNSFQVNLSQGFELRGRVDVCGWATDLLTREPGPFSAWLKRPRHSILSQSPERLIRRERDNTLITRPIAGTLARGHGSGEAERIAAFRREIKELAEHNMLVDLERNDLGKVSTVGSVHVSEHLALETYPHLYHLVSEVRSVLDGRFHAGDILKAVFPGGTITGCPKLETQHIIDKIEMQTRGPYTGSLGYLRSGGELDFNILIRTAHVTEKGARFRAGGGIVWDSLAEREYEETMTKARGLVNSLMRGGAQLDPDHRSLRQFFA